MTIATAAATEYLQPLSGGEVKLLACDGTKTIANDGIELFTCSIDPEFKAYGANERGLDTPEARGQVYKLIKRADFLMMFGNLDKGIGKLALTEHQILGFVLDHADLLPIGLSAMLIPCKRGETFSVVCVSHRIGGLDVRRCEFGFRHVWRAEDGHRALVVSDP